jgi:hypothetical protein
VERNQEEATRLVKAAAEQRFAPAEFSLGIMYEAGICIPQDTGQALRWYQKAAEQGDSRAQNNLAGMYEEGAAVPQNLDEALRWYKLAAEQGNGNSYVNLAHIYAGARGFTPDYSQAYFWTLLAQGTTWPLMKRPSPAFLELLRGKLTPEQAAEAESQAETWKAQHASDLVDGGGTWSLLVLPEGSPEE